jgi:hypothetical protein
MTCTCIYDYKTSHRKRAMYSDNYTIHKGNRFSLFSLEELAVGLR